MNKKYYNCLGLTSIVVDEGNSVYDSRNNCNAIIETATNTLHSGCQTTVIPNSVTSIGENAFDGCSGLTSVTIGSGVTSIGMYAFRNCFELLDVYCYAEKVPSTVSDAFSGSYPENATLHVPATSVDSYKAKTLWSSFGKIVALTPEETGIDELKGENGKRNSAVYDLSDRRVQKAQKGIFIRDGKVVVK